MIRRNCLPAKDLSFDRPSGRLTNPRNSLFLTVSDPSLGLAKRFRSLPQLVACLHLEAHFANVQSTFDPNSASRCGGKHFGHTFGPFQEVVIVPEPEAHFVECDDWVFRKLRRFLGVTHDREMNFHPGEQHMTRDRMRPMLGMCEVYVKSI